MKPAGNQGSYLDYIVIEVLALQFRSDSDFKIHTLKYFMSKEPSILLQAWDKSILKALRYTLT